jgi:hydrogenase maturation protein HypF
VYRLSSEMNLPGWVANSPAGVFIEAEGEKPALDDFLLRLQKETPPRASVQSLEFSILDPVGYTDFTIRESDQSGDATTLVTPDIATCPECLSEILDPSNRRYRYPFTNCTNCGPRYSILLALPYDRPNTTMAAFRMCELCLREYATPTDRRFHAQPNACPVCGPRIELWSPLGETLAVGDDALLATEHAVRQGQVVALKGLGGFHLIADARDQAAVARLRMLKRREEKPFALMFPSTESIEEICEVSPLERRLLTSPECPIVLLRRKKPAGRASLVAPGVAPGNPALGVMIPYTPLHHLLMRELEFPIVATSGNISDEPICTDEHEALHRLRGMTDLFLIHNRPIRRHVDDSVVRVILGRELVLRRARGYAPLPIKLSHDVPDMIAVGPHLKNTVAVARGRNAFISQHIGDLETRESLQAFEQEIVSLQSLYQIRPVQVVSDLHPDYLSTQYAQRLGLPVLQVQHHFAHVASCMAENDLQHPVLGVSWDGTGYGTDGTLWGGEFLLTAADGFRRTATIRPFLLPGGDAAVKEPRRSALGVLYETLGPAVFERKELGPLKAFDDVEAGVLRQMLQKKLNSPATTSIGRLFDAVASILGVRQRCAFEGQAAVELEYLADGVATEAVYEFAITKDGNAGQEKDLRLVAQQTIDWSAMLQAIIDDIAGGVGQGTIAAKFHNTLTEIIVTVARATGVRHIALTGGCFQNRILTERSVHRLREEGFRPYWHQRVPPNDGGISLGQLNAAAFTKPQH